ncbi:MAG TPA: hypothetical protein VH394_06595 [Thermoanaerobaculia bacterium]|jgi:hypothetical protein|nr:hypothetical protein [Thermoanaerobaculia bacterium]
MGRHPLRTARLDPQVAHLQKRLSDATSWERWLEETDRLADEIRSRRGRDLSVDDLLLHSRQDLENRTE